MEGFKEFQKIHRLHREVIVSEKIDGTNASIHFGEDALGMIMRVGSRSRWITPEDDNFGFAKWAHENRKELERLGPGSHYGEWYGQGIQRGYGLNEKRFALFNTDRWSDPASRPSCCGVVPVIWRGTFNEGMIIGSLDKLIIEGSHMVPGFMRPEGIVVFHTQANMAFKKTIEKDEEHKSQKKGSKPRGGTNAQE